MINSSNALLYFSQNQSFMSFYSTNPPQTEQLIQWENYIKFRLFSSVVSLGIIIIGLVGNFISFLILTSPKMRISTNVFLSSLCVSGFIALFGLLINSVLYELLAMYQEKFPELFNLLCRLYPYIYPIITTFQMASILLTVCVSVNQFIYIYFSKLRSQSKNCTKQECQRALKIVVLMFMISIIYCVPYWLKFSYSKENGLQETEIARTNLFQKIVHFYMYLPIAYIIPFSILIFTNAYLIATIAMKKKREQKLGMKEKKQKDYQEEMDLSSPNREKHQVTSSLMTVTLKNPLKSNGVNLYKLSVSLNKPRPSVTKLKKTRKESTLNKSVTIMLIAVVFLFFICQFPALILHIIQSMVCSSNTDRCSSSYLLNYCYVISKMLLIINLSFNFVCYCFFSPKFRLVLKESLPKLIFCC